MKCDCGKSLPCEVCGKRSRNDGRLCSQCTAANWGYRYSIACADMARPEIGFGRLPAVAEMSRETLQMMVLSLAARCWPDSPTLTLQERLAMAGDRPEKP